jgi:hypothetical protein
MRFTSLTQVLESNSVRARSLLLGFSTPYSTRSQSSNVRWVCCWREVISIGLRDVGPSRRSGLLHLLPGQPML